MDTNTKQSSYETSDEVYTGTGRYPYQAIPAAFVKQIDKQLKENVE